MAKTEKLLLLRQVEGVEDNELNSRALKKWEEEEEEEAKDEEGGRRGGRRPRNRARVSGIVDLLCDPFTLKLHTDEADTLTDSAAIIACVTA